MADQDELSFVERPPSSRSVCDKSTKGRFEIETLQPVRWKNKFFLQQSSSLPVMHSALEQFLPRQTELKSLGSSLMNLLGKMPHLLRLGEDAA